jgi:hypothetical protein
MTAALVKLVTAGLLCAALLTLNGGGQKELLRLGCACLTVVVLLSVLRQTELPALDTQRYQAQVQPRVEEAQEQVRQAQLEQTAEQLAAELERQAAVLGLTCNAQVDCAADREGRVTVVQVMMTYHSGSRDQLESLRQSLCAQLAIAPGQIIIQEGTP